MADGAGVKRFGLASGNIADLEQRLLQIEKELAKRQTTALFEAGAPKRALATAPPQVSGVRLVRNIGTITAEWNKLNISNLSFYELDIASNLSFTEDKRTVRVTDNFYTFQEGDPGTSYHIRVRGIINDTPGPWSGVLNALTGTVAAESLAPGSASAVAEQTLVSFDPVSVSATNGSTDTATYGSVSIRSTGGVILPRVISESVVTSASSSVGPVPATLLLEFIRNPGGAVIGAYTFDFQSNYTGGTFTVGGFSEIDDPPAGVHTYSLRITVSTVTGSTLTIDPSRQVIQLIELTSA